jgi:hypothetical protein
MLSFAQLDRLIGGLPPSAREHPSWWGNTVNDSHVHAHAWVSVGWLAEADLQNERVRFVKGSVARGSGAGKPMSKPKQSLCPASSIWVPAGYIMDTFPIVRRKDEAAYGEYRTKRLILERYDALAACIASGTEYQTILDPPPAHRSLAHPESTRPEWCQL